MLHFYYLYSKKPSNYCQKIQETRKLLVQNTLFTSIPITGNVNILRGRQWDPIYEKILENTMNTINTFSLYWFPLLLTNIFKHTVSIKSVLSRYFEPPREHKDALWVLVKVLLQQTVHRMHPGRHPQVTMNTEHTHNFKQDNIQTKHVSGNKNALCCRNKREQVHLGTGYAFLPYHRRNTELWKPSTLTPGKGWVYLFLCRPW